MPRTTLIHEIRLMGIAERGHHGVHNFERTEGQLFVVDAILKVEIDESSPQSDDLAQSADYSAVIARIRGLVAGNPVNLIESLARRILLDLLSFHSSIHSVEVTVHKPDAPINPKIADISVTVRDSRK